MKKLRGIGTAGLTLVELIISMAILAVVGTAIGGAMYVSSRSYTRGASEVNVQEEAQVAANLICDWIVDATSVNPDGSGGYLTGSSTSLVIIHPEGDKLVEVTVSQSGSELVYVAKDVTDPSDGSYGSEVGSGTLAKNLDGCTFYSTFGTDRNVKISLDFSVNERTYRAVTDSTSRSHDFISTGGTSTLSAPALHLELVSNTGGPHITLEPGQNSTVSSYSFYVVVDSCDVDTLTGSGVTYTAPAGGKTEVVSCVREGTSNKWKVTIKSHDDAVNDESYIFSATNYAGTGTTPLTVRIRRVNDCTVTNYTVDGSGRHVLRVQSGTSGSAGSTYTSPILLDATNYQQETNIIGANSLVIGQNGFDAAPWGYINPTSDETVKVQFRSWNGTSWVNRASDIQSYSVVSNGADAVLNVRLKNNITESIAVVITATHSGSITGHANSSSDAHCGVSLPANNKANSIDGRTLSYGPSVAPSGKEAFYDVVWIAPTEDNPIPNVGGGIRRGVPACMVAEWDSDFRNTLITRIKAATGLTRTQEDIEWNNGASLRYTTVMKFRPINPNTGLGYGDYQTAVLCNITNFEQLFSDFTARRLRSNLSSVFKLDTAYEVEYDFDVYYKQNGTWVKKISIAQTGSVCAATPYVYDPHPSVGDTANFKNGKYTKDNPLSIPSGSKYQLGLYVDGVINNEQLVGWKCEYWDPNANGGAGGWIEDNDVVIKDDKHWAQGSYTLNNPYYKYEEVHLPNGDSYKVGQYFENEPKHNNINATLQFFDIVPGEMTSGRLYRVRFVTNWDEYETFNWGVVNGESDQYAKATGTLHTHTYTLNGDMYFRLG